jgi:hypothetical protein
METNLIQTTDYDSLKVMPGNRAINERHVQRLMDSFKKEYLTTVIYVNAQGQVVDGQHRVEAAKRLGLPLWVASVNGYGLPQVQKFNSLSKTWSMKDYVHSYSNLGTKSYLQLKEFMDNNPDFGMMAAISICSNSSRGKRGKDVKVEGKRTSKNSPFKDGEFEIADLPLAYENAGKIRAYGEFFRGYNKTRFVETMITLFKNRKFKHDVMISKLRLQPSALVQCATIEQYKRIIEDIYNYKSHSKVSLRF